MQQTHARVSLARTHTHTLWHTLEPYTGKLAATQWRTRFGRPSQVPRLGEVDPTGRFCAFPEDWLKQRAGKNHKEN